MLTGKDAEEYAARVDAEARALQESMLAGAKAAAQARGKEPFDLAKLETMCDTSREGRLAPLAERTKEYERQYYIDFPQTMTLEEFAKIVDELQRW